MSRVAVFTLQKNERLKSRKIIEWIFTKGKKIRSKSLLVAYIFENCEDRVGVLKFGVGVSSKKIKESVGRNRTKRLIREAYRINNLQLKQAVSNAHKDLAVFFIYSSKEIPEHKTIEAEVKILLEKLNQLVIETVT